MPDKLLGQGVVPMVVKCAISMLVLLVLVSAVLADPGGTPPAQNLVVSGPALSRQTVRPNENVEVRFSLRNPGADAIFEAALDVLGPNGQTAYQSRSAPDKPGRNLDIDRDSTAVVVFTFQAPGWPGTYTWRLRLRERFSTVWQNRVPDTGWPPLFVVDPRAPEVADSVAWSTDDFSRRVKQALESIVDAYQRRDAPTILANVSDNYRGFSTTGGSEDRSDLAGSLQGDFQIFSYYDLNGMQAEAFRVTSANRQAEVILFWNAYARFDANNTDINMRGRRTRLVFVDEGGQARLLYQDIASVRNGSVLFGQTDSLTGKAILTADPGSTAGTGRLVATAASWGAMTVKPE